MDGYSSQITGITDRVNFNKHIQLSRMYVLDSWLPVEPQLLQHIKNGLNSGRYEQARTLLLDDLKKDFSLFMFCVRRLSEILRLKSDPLLEWIDPVEIFETSSLDDFKTILESPASFISRHRLEQASDFQVERLTHSIMSATVAHALSKSHGINPNLAYASALFRQLGLALIAWNYPHVYKRVLDSLTAQETLDQALSKLLGFSPSLLGVTIAQSWSICPKVRLAMGDVTAENNMDGQSIAVGKALEKICKIGEALARASSPEHYPSATSDWRTAWDEIERNLGREQATNLSSAIAHNLSNYLKAAPDLFKLPELFTQEAQVKEQQIAARITRNKYIQYCSSSMQENFSALYAKLKSETVQKDTIDFLINQIILPAGFVRGCVYLVEPDMLKLVPRLAIGDARLTDFKPLSYNTFSYQGNPVIAAFRSHVPIVEECDQSSGDRPAYIAGALGNLQRAGVLYLEVSRELNEDPHANPLVYFKAVREALNECLHLN